MIDSGPHNGLATFADHRMVRIMIGIKPQTIKRTNLGRPLEYNKLRTLVTGSAYSVKVELKLIDKEDEDIMKGRQAGRQEKWNIII